MRKLSAAAAFAKKTTQRNDGGDSDEAVQQKRRQKLAEEAALQSSVRISAFFLQICHANYIYNYIYIRAYIYICEHNFIVLIRAMLCQKKMQT